MLTADVLFYGRVRFEGRDGVLLTTIESIENIGDDIYSRRTLDQNANLKLKLVLAES
jgi:hypothetical protein